MIIKQSGVERPFFMGTVTINGIKLTWFSETPGVIERKESEWRELNAPVSESREKQRPQLRLVVGGKQ